LATQFCALAAAIPVGVQALSAMRSRIVAERTNNIGFSMLWLLLGDVRIRRIVYEEQYILMA
jgi:hypothetical protein